MTVIIADPIVCDLTCWNEISDIFGDEFPGRIWSHSWPNPIAHTIGTQYKHQTNGLQRGHDYQRPPATALFTKTVDSECQSGLAVTHILPMVVCIEPSVQIDSFHFSNLIVYKLSCLAFTIEKSKRKDCILWHMPSRCLEKLEKATHCLRWSTIYPKGSVFVLRLFYKMDAQTSCSFLN